MTQVMVSVTPGMNWMGAWSATTAYKPTNVVSSVGASYICIADNTNQQPPNATYWNLVAASGAGGIPATSVTGPDVYGASPVVGTGTEFARQDHDHGLPAAPADLPLAGGTMTGPIAMGSHKITGLANGSAPQDAAAYGQLPSVPSPASSVTGPDAYGAAAVVGSSSAYARQDHDHGLPAPPFVWMGAWSSIVAYVVGDAVSSGGSSYICILGNTNQEPPNATYWNLLALEGTSGVPATSVTGPDAFGASPVVGVSTDYARQDHDHGLPTPTYPVGGSSIVGPDAFGTSASVGSAVTWAASDHDHGLPAAPADLPLAGGTMTGPIAMGSHKITGLANGSAPQDAAAYGQLPSVPSPASSVTGPDAYGAAAVVGSSSAYARQDHDHGLASPYLGVWAPSEQGPYTTNSTTWLNLGSITPPTGHSCLFIVSGMVVLAGNQLGSIFLGIDGTAYSPGINAWPNIAVGNPTIIPATTFVVVGGLAAGAHTLQLQFYVGGGGTSVSFASLIVVGLVVN